jgi:hypothetical protein
MNATTTVVGSTTGGVTVVLATESEDGLTACCSHLLVGERPCGAPAPANDRGRPPRRRARALPNRPPREARAMTGPFKSTTKPGEFRAYCRKGEWLPLSDVLAWPREEQPDTTTSRWDGKRKTEVCIVPCDLEFTDPKVFEAHMAERHGKKPTMTPYPDQSTRSLSNRARGKWRTPKAPADHVPVKPSLKDVADSLRVCDCGFVFEHDGTWSADQWWREHVERCTERAA